MSGRLLNKIIYSILFLCFLLSAIAADLQGQGNPCPKKNRYFPGLSVFFNPPFSRPNSYHPPSFPTHLLVSTHPPIPSHSSSGLYSPSNSFSVYLLISSHLRTSTFSGSRYVDLQASTCSGLDSNFFRLLRYLRTLGER